VATLQVELYPAYDAVKHYSFRSIRGILCTVIALFLADVHSVLPGSAEPTVRVIAGIGALVMVFIIVFRRTNVLKKNEEDKS
jgi:hypothetical protein